MEMLASLGGDLTRGSCNESTEMKEGSEKEEDFHLTVECVPNESNAPNALGISDNSHVVEMDFREGPANITGHESVEHKAEVMATETKEKYERKQIAKVAKAKEEKGNFLCCKGLDKREKIILQMFYFGFLRIVFHPLFFLPVLSDTWKRIAHGTKME